MIRLTGFEFVALDDGPSLVRLKDGDYVFAEFSVIGWLGFFTPETPALLEKAENLVIEGHGVGRPYWNDEIPPWVGGFDPVKEAVRIQGIRRAAFELENRGGSMLAMQ